MPRVRESDLVIPTLRILNAKPGGFATTSTLIYELEDYFSPEGIDDTILQGRNDTHFSQKVRNLVSHRQNSTGLETRGWASYDQQREGWTITDAGVLFLAQMGELDE